MKYEFYFIRGFKNPMTAELAYKRAHKLKYAAEKRRKQRSMGTPGLAIC